MSPAARSRQGATTADSERALATELTPAAPSPFPPIADYGFLSNCHTGALVALDASIDWLCVPRFDSPSVFGTLLDRRRFFRLGPFGVNVPTARTYEPGTNVLTTTWNTPSGWVVVHDALTMGPRRGKDVITPHTRPPADDDCDHVLLRTVLCLSGNVEVELVCEPVFDYGRRRRRGRWSRRHHRRREGAGQTIRLRPTWRSASRANAGHATLDRASGHCSLWAEGSSPQSIDEADAQLDATTRFWRFWPSLARSLAADERR
jgi:GH15 family glucan-1,4-alpha-glucosidase